MANISIFVILVILKSVTSSVLNVDVNQVNKIFHGRYTRNVNNGELLIPHHVYQDGKFKSFNLPNFYSRNDINKRKKRLSLYDSNNDKLHLILPFNGKEHHIELSPFHDFISPDMVIEIRGEGTGTNITKGLRFHRASDEQCHYRGFVRGHRDSRAALSLCEGVAGYILINNERFFIEPLDNSLPGGQGQHVHIIYKRRASGDEKESKGVCGTSDDWELAWTTQFARHERQLIKNSTSKPFEQLENDKNATASTHSIHRYIEIGLVADQKLLEFWKDSDVHHYLLTIMNMAADYYHDASIGNQIDVILVRMIYMEGNGEYDFNVTSNAGDTLNQFARWAQKINPKDPTHPHHFDIGVLITRHDICSEKSGCGLTGLAFMTAACNPEKAAALCEDNGLLSGIIVAHEVGHVMGCSHDGEKISGCPKTDTDLSNFIMSPSVDMNTYRWSPCSRRYITNLLSSGLGDCLMDNPKNPAEIYVYPNMLPGAMYDADSQCSMISPDSYRCDVRDVAFCERLWCHKEKSCFSDGSPPAEGTPCGENKWCIKKKCVPMGQRPKAIHGGWSEWGQAGTCSRTCGGGVQLTERECDNPKPSDGGRYCIGERRRISICNTDPCDPDTPSFIAVQCSAHDSQESLYVESHKWTPFIPENDDPCMLYCINEKHSYTKFGLVKDGTPCESGTKNMCISGTCRKIGCDWKLDSDAVVDHCGTCDGDGTGCETIGGRFTNTRSFGYTKVVTIPKEAKNIKIIENRSSQNVLAVKYENNNKYCINGNLRLNNMGEFDCAGSRLIYTQPQSDQEEVQIKGPLTDDIQIQVCNSPWRV